MTARPPTARPSLRSPLPRRVAARVSATRAWARGAFWLLAALSSAALSSTVEAQERRQVDLELALMIDVSASVSDEEFALQVEGLAAALSSPEVLDAIAISARRGIAVAVMQWSNAENQRLAVDWTFLRDEASTLEMAARIQAMPRMIQGGHTAISNALAFGLQELEINRFEGLRRVIDLSGDGRNNDGFRLASTREEVLARGITINGLPILNELPFLDRYFRDYVIGGAGAFYVVAEDYPDFAYAMVRKLVREISASPISRGPPTGSAQAARRP